MRRLLFLTIILLVVAGSPLRVQKVVGSARVVDGERLEIGGIRVRLYGIDAPEAGQIHGQAAIATLVSLAAGKERRAARPGGAAFAPPRWLAPQGRSVRDGEG